MEINSALNFKDINNLNNSQNIIKKLNLSLFNLQIYIDINKEYQSTIKASVIIFVLFLFELLGAHISKSFLIYVESLFILSEFFNCIFNILKQYFNNIKKKNKIFTFGYYRAEPVFNIISLVIMWNISAYYLFLSLFSIFSKNKTKGDKLIVASFYCLSVNLLILFLIYDLTDVIKANFEFFKNKDNFYNIYSDEEHYKKGVDVKLENFNENKEEKLDEKEESLKDNNNENEENKIENKNISNNNNENQKNDVTYNNNNELDVNILNFNNIIFPIIIKLLRSLLLCFISILLKLTGFYFFDKLFSIGLIIIFLIPTLNIFKNSLMILLETNYNCPEENDIIKYIEINFPTTLKVHNMKIWSLNDKNYCIYFHIIIDDESYSKKINNELSQNKDILNTLANDLKEKFRFKEVTIQIENAIQYINICKKIEEENEII